MTNRNKKFVWSVVQLKPNMLKKAKINLERQNFEYFAPTKNVTVRVGNIFKKINKLLFPGYIFVRVNLFSTDINSLDSTYGISKIVRVGQKKIGIIPNYCIENLKFLQTKFGHDYNKFDLEGRKVRWIQGPFTNLLGEIVNCDDNSRISVLFNILNSNKIIKTDFKNVEIIYT